MKRSPVTAKSGSARAAPPNPISALARSLGHAVKFVGRVVPGSMPRKPPSNVRRAVAPTPSTDAPRVADDGTQKNLEQIRARLTQEAAKLRHELERVHAALSSHPASASAGKNSLSALTDLVQRSREIRLELQDTQRELDRIERHLARERKLRSTDEKETAEEPVVSPSVSPAWESSAPPVDRQRRCTAPTRQAVLKALGSLGLSNRSEKLALERLADDLTDEDDDTRRLAALRLGDLESASSAALLRAAVEDPSERVRLAALNALAKCRDRSAASLFRRAIRDPSSAIRVAALRGLTALGPEVVQASDLANALEDPDPIVRKTAATGLGWWRSDKTPQPEVFAGLGLALRDWASEVRLAAAQALGNLGHDRAVLTLIRALDDESQAVREVCRRALLSLAGDEVDTLGEGLDLPEQIGALKAWWRDSRVAKRVQRLAPETASSSDERWVAEPPREAARSGFGPPPDAQPASMDAAQVRAAAVAAAAQKAQAVQAAAEAAKRRDAATKSGPAATRTTGEPTAKQAKRAVTPAVDASQPAASPAPAPAPKQAEPAPVPGEPLSAAEPSELGIGAEGQEGDGEYVSLFKEEESEAAAGDEPAEGASEEYESIFGGQG